MIRLQRVGRKHEPVFRLVLTDSKNGPKSGKFLEILGNYDARRSEKAEFKTDRVKHWIANGAKLSDTVHNLLVERKEIEGKKINVLSRRSPIIKEKTEESKAEIPTTETPAETSALEAPAETAEETRAEEAPKPEAEVKTPTEVVEEKSL